MKQLIEFIPLVVFFVIYKFYGIFEATWALILCSSLTFGTLFAINKKLEKMQWISFIGILFFGAFTLFFRNEAILKFKAPIINWIFAFIFLLSPYVSQKNLVKMMLDNAFDLNPRQWRNLNFIWVIFFILTGSANLFVAFYFHSIWVDFKVFGTLALTLAFLIAQFLYLSPHLKEEVKNRSS